MYMSVMLWLYLVTLYYNQSFMCDSARYIILFFYIIYIGFLVPCDCIYI